MKKVLILDGSVDRRIYTPSQHWAAFLGGVPMDSVHPPSGEAIPDLRNYSHVIVTGSEASIVRHEPWYDVEAAAVREAMDLSKPILGSCFGHQMLAWALSGARAVRASSTPEVGWIEVEQISADYLFDGLKNPFCALAAHFDEVCDPPPPWKVLARSRGCKVQAMRYADRPVWGIQAHPELNPGQAGKLLGDFLEASPDRAAFFRAALEQPPMDDAVAGEIIRRFLKC